jgi:energy-coupling factor transporter ATP-binding protein EcfA2
MPRCSEAALEASLRQLGELAMGRERRNWPTVYLAAARIAAAGYELTTTGATNAVTDLFVLLPDHPDGRVHPFVSLDSAYRWGRVKEAGRNTVWNNATRGHPQAPLFVGNHFENGLLPNAIDVLLDALGTDEPLPGRDALSVLITRDHQWIAEPTRDELHEVARTRLGLSAADFARITADEALPCPVLGDPEWSPAELERSDLGPQSSPLVGVVGAGELEISPESVGELPDMFGQFLQHYGISVGSVDEGLDLLAATLSSQFVIMAGPSGSGKSLMASALSGFFAPKDRRCRLEATRLLARREEFFGYYSHLAGQQFMAYDQLLNLLPLANAAGDSPHAVTIEEANLSPIEGYLSPLIHGLSGLEAASLDINLHSQPSDVASQVPGVQVPSVLRLEPFPRFFATLNVDAESPAPARKVVSRACVVLLETPPFTTALAASDTLVQPSVDEATGPAAALLGRPRLAYERYAATGSDLYQQALTVRADVLRQALGHDVIAHRALQKSLLYMAWFMELSGVAEAVQGEPAIEAAADNALLSIPQNRGGMDYEE